MKNRKHVGYRKEIIKPKWSIVLLAAIIIALLFIIIFRMNDDKVHETYTERQYQEQNGILYEKEYKRERSYTADDFDPNLLYAGMSLELYEINARAHEAAVKSTIAVVKTVERTANKTVSVKQSEPNEQPVKHLSESTYVKGAKMLHGEAGGVPSTTERSGPLWVVCNRVDSDDPFFPDNLESVIEQEWQFDGYSPDGDYTQADYDLAVDVFERWYREKHGETAAEVGRTLPSDYLFFTGDGEHNYFRKTQDGPAYVWGSELASPYKD